MHILLSLPQTLNFHIYLTTSIVLLLYFVLYRCRRKTIMIIFRIPPIKNLGQALKTPGTPFLEILDPPLGGELNPPLGGEVSHLANGSFSRFSKWPPNGNVTCSLFDLEICIIPIFLLHLTR